MSTTKAQAKKIEVNINPSWAMDTDECINFILAGKVDLSINSEGPEDVTLEAETIADTFGPYDIDEWQFGLSHVVDGLHQPWIELAVRLTQPQRRLLLEILAEQTVCVSHGRVTALKGPVGVQLRGPKLAVGRKLRELKLLNISVPGTWGPTVLGAQVARLLNPTGDSVE